MNVCVYKLNRYKNYGDKIKPSQGDFSSLSDYLFLDTLKISNIKETGPTKTFKAGAFNIPIIRTGKNISIEIQDALGRLDTLKHFFGLREILDSDNNLYSLYRNNASPCPLALEGELKIVNAKNNQTETIFLFIPFFLPDGNLNITADADNNVGVFDLSGSIFPVKIQYGNTIHTEFYSISSSSMLNTSTLGAIASEDDVIIYTVLNDPDKTYIYSGDNVTIQLENLTFY